MLVTKHQRYKPSAHASAKLWRKILILQARAKQDKTRRQAESSVPQAGCSEEFELVVWTPCPYHLEVEVHQSIVRHGLDRAVERRDSSTQSEILLSPRKLDNRLVFTSQRRSGPEVSPRKPRGSSELNVASSPPGKTGSRELTSQRANVGQDVSVSILSGRVRTST